MPSSDHRACCFGIGGTEFRLTLARTMKPVTSLSAPAAIGPYSQAIDAGDFVFLSGQVPIDPKTGELVQGDIAVQTDRVLDNLGAVLEAAGCSFADVVKTTIYLTDLGDFQVVNATYGKRFTAAPPARATIQVAALPKGARVEIDAIARKRA
jgi:2-iminobutanoate/2-iminopropanoate deaminase